MNGLKTNSSAGTEFFGAVSRNCNTVIVKSSKRAVKSEIVRRGVAKHNVVIFKCRAEGKAIIKEALHRPRFKLNHQHHAALMDASLAFLRGRVGAS